MAELKAEVSCGDQEKVSAEFLPPVAESKGLIIVARPGRCQIKHLYRPFQELTFLTVVSDSMVVWPSDVTMCGDGSMHPSLTLYP